MGELGYNNDLLENLMLRRAIRSDFKARTQTSLSKWNDLETEEILCWQMKPRNIYSLSTKYNDELRQKYKNWRRLNSLSGKVLKFVESWDVKGYRVFKISFCLE